MAQSKDSTMDVRNIAEERHFMKMKLDVVSTGLGENPDQEFPNLEGLECILNDQVALLATLAEKLFDLSGGTGELFAQKAAGPERPGGRR